MNTRTTLAGMVLAMLIATGTPAADRQAQEAAGIWRTTSGGYVQLYADDSTWKGKIVGSRDGKARYDKQNPDASKRDRRLLGIIVLKDLTYAGDGEFEGGTIYDPNNGKTYKARATQTGPDTLDVRGYIGISLIGKSQTWHRVDPQTANVRQDLLEHSSATDANTGS